MEIVWLVVFYVFYAAAFVIFKRGSLSKKAWLPCFIIGNVFGVSGTGILMLLYKVMNVNVALGLALGGGFAIAQLAVAFVYKNRLTALQYVGIAVVAAGIGMMVMG
ncbi:MAG: hypothetical protein FWF44_01125 [Defluviitaleaceae bacterium]|nr:hypothetical protein [Defluviitaleaceae bacterium]